MNFRLIHVSTWMSSDLSSGPSQRSHSSTRGIALRPVCRVSREARPRPLCFGLPPLLQSGADLPGGSVAAPARPVFPCKSSAQWTGPSPAQHLHSFSISCRRKPAGLAAACTAHALDPSPRRPPHGFSLGPLRLRAQWLLARQRTHWVPLPPS